MYDGIVCIMCPVRYRYNHKYVELIILILLLVLHMADNISAQCICMNVHIILSHP